MDFSKEEPNLPSDSDDSDDDYVPSGAESNPPSEVESEGDDEDDPPESDEDDPNTKKRKRGQKGSKKKARKKGRKSAPKDDVNIEENDGDDDENSDKIVVTEEEEKKRADSLWADFMSDTKSYKPQPKKITPVSSKHEETEDKTLKEKAEPKKEEKENKVTITEVFEFAGEEVKVTKEVDIASKAARIAQASPKPVGSSSSGPPVGCGRGRSPGGLSSILGQIGKKSKIGTLEKSKLDWDHFKKSQGIEEELKTFNRGKDGYLEKQDFLQRADLRQFEIEKSLRATRRSNR